jgi:DNA-binding CsgD family transcriptional regulator
LVTSHICAPPTGTEHRCGGAQIGDLLAALGTERFGEALMRFLKATSEARDVHFFHMVDNRPHILHSASFDGTDRAAQQAGFYLSHKLFALDPWVTAWAAQPQARALFHVDRATPQHAEMHDFYDAMQIGDRIALCGNDADGAVGISLSRPTDGRPFEDTPERVELLRDIALPLFMKHREFHLQRARIGRELHDVADIEHHIGLSAEDLPRREAQVAARLLRGFTASAIAMDLGISRTTVISYRNRLFDKLSLGSNHDLLAWYMSCAGTPPMILR